MIDFLTEICSYYDCFICSYIGDFVLFSKSKEELLSCLGHIEYRIDIKLLTDVVYVDNEYRIYFMLKERD